MAPIEVHVSRSGRKLFGGKRVPTPVAGLKAAAPPPGKKAKSGKKKAKVAATPFSIEVRSLGGLTTAQKNAFKKAANRCAASSRAVRS